MENFSKQIIYVGTLMKIYFLAYVSEKFLARPISKVLLQKIIKICCVRSLNNYPFICFFVKLFQDLEVIKRSYNYFDISSAVFAIMHNPNRIELLFFFAQKRLISCKRFKIHFGFHPQCALVSLSRAEKSKRTSEIFRKLVDIFEAAVVPNLRTLKVMNIEIERARMQSLLMCTVVVVQVVVVLGQGGEEWL